MSVIDLTHIIFRAHQTGDEPEPKNIPDVATGAIIISLAGIKFRSKEHGGID